MYNGIDPADFHFRPTKDDYDLFLGRLHSIKGYRWAIEGAKRTKRRLLLAGGWRPSLSRYVRYVGRVGGEKKAALLAGAGCLWMPALWDEPFGITLIEAMVSGTPVLGTRRGSLPEIVSPAVGALGDSVDELVALRPELDPDRSRRVPRAGRALLHPPPDGARIRADVPRVPRDGSAAGRSGDGDRDRIVRPLNRRL